MCGGGRVREKDKERERKRERPLQTFCSGRINQQTQRLNVTIDPGLFVTGDSPVQKRRSVAQLQNPHQSYSLSGHLTTKISHLIYQLLEILMCDESRSCSSTHPAVKNLSDQNRPNLSLIEGFYFVSVRPPLNSDMVPRSHCKSTVFLQTQL